MTDFIFYLNPREMFGQLDKVIPRGNKFSVTALYDPVGDAVRPFVAISTEVEGVMHISKVCHDLVGGFYANEDDGWVKEMRQSIIDALTELDLDLSAGSAWSMEWDRIPAF